MVQPNIIGAKERLLRAVEAQRKLRRRLVNPTGFLADVEAEEPETPLVELENGEGRDGGFDGGNTLPPRR